MPFLQLVHILCQLFLSFYAFEITAYSPVIQVVIQLLLWNVPINTITVKLLTLKIKKMEPLGSPKDSTAWIVQTWAAFILSVSMSTFGIVNLPVDVWIKGFMGMGLAFSIGSTFTLAKTTRDSHEAKKLTARIDEAKVEKLLSQHDPLNFK